ncbi:helix-turn-helix domain-containing protein [Halorussus gelatinilyticus]|uniref:Helix-turn-helix domain-containing protein n=1 Tax=Halorussus gelatinilyticus TaxID=2937524 RepID=A0A8U0IQC1_9EURY|nr:helix-turn-helix domain-containing protein [Halorussus gelatinilyticus]UPW02209.1 helix-turn-helix domain-containing protein [Halorussus gelatinilyticus]
MSVIAEFTTPAEEFTLGDALAAHPDVRVELEKVVPTRKEVVPFFWARGRNLDAFAETVRQQSGVETLEQVEGMDDRILYRVDWTDATSDLGRVLRTGDATVLEASGQDDTWHFELRFTDHDGVRSFQTECVDNDVALELRRLHSLSEVGTEGSYDLTPEQRETLLTALERGYFEEPRDITLEQLADELGLSPTAVSGRMRRAEAKLISRTLVTET